jgi:hypothetical protein
MRRSRTLRVGSWRRPESACTDSAKEGHVFLLFRKARHRTDPEIEQNVLILATNRFPRTRISVASACVSDKRFIFPAQTPVRGDLLILLVESHEPVC